MEDKKIDPTESLQIINAMIDTAKNKLADDGFLYIFWGWLVLCAALINYFCVQVSIPYGHLAWGVLMPLGGVVSMIYSYKQGKTEKTRTYIDTYFGYLWLAFIIALATTLLFMNVHGIKATYFFLMLLYGIATLVSGGLLNFRPLIVGSFFSFLFAVLSVFAGVNEQLICISGAILCSYIIPGHLLQAKFKSQVDV